MDKLKDFAVKKQTTGLNARREYAQHLFLTYFYRQKEARNVFFKGGTALRLIYNSPRFSEDLDFSSTLARVNQIEDIVQNTLVEIEREGIETEIMESKQTTGGYLAIVGFQLRPEKVNIQLEISGRERNIAGEVIVISSDFIPAYPVVVLTRKQLVGEKIRALLTRQKPRDFYDLYFILRSNLLPAAERKILLKVLTQLQHSHLSFTKELPQFLPKSHWLVIKDFKNILEREIQRFI